MALRESEQTEIERECQRVRYVTLKLANSNERPEAERVEHEVNGIFNVEKK